MRSVAWPTSLRFIFAAYPRLIDLVKEELAFPYPLARFVIGQVRAGQQVVNSGRNTPSSIRAFRSSGSTTERNREEVRPHAVENLAPSALAEEQLEPFQGGHIKLVFRCELRELDFPVMDQRCVVNDLQPADKV